jgi:hypothetical protein
MRSVHEILKGNSKRLKEIRKGSWKIEKEMGLCNINKRI